VQKELAMRQNESPLTASAPPVRPVAEGAVPERLVDVDWLVEHLDDPAVRPVEAGLDSTAYYEGHVPGAATLSWLDDLHEADRRGVLSQSHVEELMSSRGITPQSHVVLYGDGDNMFAAYALWLLRYYRHGPVSLLDGGRRAWLAAGAPLASDVPPVSASSYVSPGTDETLRATRDLLLERYVGSPSGTALLDCRGASVFHGRAGSATELPVMFHRLTGHVPGARNLPSSDLLDPQTGRFRPHEELSRAMADHGIGPQDEVVLYCDVGQRSALAWFVLHEMLQHPHVRHYDGGWAEYGSLVGAPVSR
jgi:thiosulfate/3-mercaptopyruvate sulfurtransferase